MILRRSGWFVEWLFVGAGYAFGVLAAASIGLLVLPVPVVATIVLLKHHSSSHAAAGFGIASGLGLPLLYVAYLNRSGPGTICTSTSTMHRCDQELNPWPWLVVGALLVLAGAAAFVIRERRERIQEGLVAR